MCCSPSSRPFLREMIAEPDSLLSKYPLETNLVVTNITTLFQLAIFQHLLGKGFFPLTLRYIFSHFKALNPTPSQKSALESQQLDSNAFAVKPPILLFKISFWPSKSWQHKRSVFTLLFTVIPKNANIHVYMATQVALHDYFEFCKENLSNSAVLTYRLHTYMYIYKLYFPNISTPVP